ncbi:Conserved domain protein [Mycoavidus cysteinexigens]|uniref:Conserved domain protein n=1 Tax=Mycoavidus cysteinexigens TaxID=1553431 RepID=A0A2Z6EWS6_9BURK|nr:hypothetical protein [Mycoavidus cysteinexigens]BBE09852.1 Conserved domain protein [Mycoavidus cysteinexigens]GAM53800.1 conserved hypothetical protein [bacterium endosymbiont of Mortierella elongata FMR23-6]GLR02300.1 hypothetical protein GCM10007934_21160 [Mycoavidus cysteinexigens]
MPYMISFERIGREQGRKQGLAEGVQRGQSTLLKTLLENKFGLLAEPYQQRLNKANVDTLQQWGKRTLIAQTLDEVF